MRTGTLERPIPYPGHQYYQLKCESCDSKAFAINLPNDLDKYYESWEKGEERTSMFPKLFSSISEGHYYHYVPITCAKCGADVEGMPVFRSLTDLQSGDWKPLKERNASGAESETKNK